MTGAHRPAEIITPPTFRIDELHPEDPWWIKKAWGEMGQAETPSPDTNNPRIQFYDSFAALSRQYLVDETPWCSAFENFLFGGIKYGTFDAMARSWLEWKYGIAISGKLPRGAVVVHSSPTRGVRAGHVTNYLGDAEHGYMWVVGGNQNNRVGIDRWPYATLLGARWPNSKVAPV